MKESKKTLTLFLILFILVSTKMYAENGDSLVFQNQTINGVVSIQNPSIIEIRNAVVKEKGHLFVTSLTGVELNNLFEVHKGGTLEIKIAPMRAFRYTYDSVGNVKSRKRE